MSELLIIKEGTDYFRFTDLGYERCSLNKASVFALEKIAEVRPLLHRLQQDGHHDAQIMQLSISEKPYTA